MIQPFSKTGLKAMNFLFRFSVSKSLIKNDTKEYLKDVYRGNRFFSQSIIALGYPSGSEDYIRLTKLYSLAVNFRSNKKLVKAFLGNLLLTPTFIFMALLPFGVPFFLFEYRLGGGGYFLTYLLTLVFGLLIALIMNNILEFVNNFNVKMGKALTRMIQVTIIGSFCALLYFVLPIEEGIFKATFLSIYSITFLIIAYSIFEYVFSEVLVDSFYYSRKIQITDALIIESSFRLANMKWVNAIRNKTLRQGVLDEIERLSGLIEKDWSSHVIAGDEKTNRYKVRTLTSIANRFRRFKRSLIIPSANTATELETQFNSIFEKVLKHDLQALIDAEVTAERLKKKSRFAILQSFLVAVLPIFSVLIIKNYFAGVIDESVLHIGIALSGLWLLICLLLWLDPNLADKLATIKSFKDVIKGDNS